jgi:hypothetical protein
VAVNCRCRAAISLAAIRAPGGDIWWQAQVNDPTEPVPDDVPDTEWLARLGARYAAHPLQAAIIADTVHLHRRTVNHVLDPFPASHRGPVVLVGDAAHPLGSGQGASMAIEDGLVLATALGTAGSVPEALAAYERERAPRIAKVRKVDRDTADVKWAGAVRCGAVRCGAAQARGDDDADRHPALLREGHRLAVRVPAAGTASAGQLGTGTVARPRSPRRRRGPRPPSGCDNRVASARTRRSTPGTSPSRGRRRVVPAAAADRQTDGDSALTMKGRTG